jgi:molybdate transport system substrate-binding protein
MDKLVADGFATGHAPVVIAYNKLEIVVAPHNPKEIVRLEDLARPEVTYISAGPTVPAGKYAAQVLGKAGVKATPRSLETDVKSVVSKIELGEADAGIVYVTDVKAAGDKVTGVEIPDQYNVVATYPAVIVKGAAHPEVAQGFIDYLTHGPGLTLLATYGFQPA